MPSAWDFCLCSASWHNSKEELLEFPAMANRRLFRIFSMCHIDLLFQTYVQKTSFQPLSVELKPETDSDSDFSSPNCKSQSTA